MERYAKISDGVVRNVLTIRRSQAAEFPDCVAMGDIPAGIGDTYEDGLFYRGGKQVKTEVQKKDDQLQATSEAALSAAQETCKAHNEPPKADAGIFVRGATPWEAGKAYAQYDLFEYGGAVGWVKQAHTSQETWLPFTAGTEALYGARPAPDEDGVYPYTYNMAVDVGMRVLEDGVIYVCIQATNDLLWPPSQVPALFKAE